MRTAILNSCAQPRPVIDVLSDLWGKTFVLTDVLTIGVLAINALDGVLVDVGVDMLTDVELIVVARTAVTVEFALSAAEVESSSFKILELWRFEGAAQPRAPSFAAEMSLSWLEVLPRSPGAVGLKTARL